MQLKLIFENGTATIVASAEGEQERRLLGAFAGIGGYDSNVVVTYEGHPTNGRIAFAKIELTAKKPTPQDQAVPFKPICA